MQSVVGHRTSRQTGLLVKSCSQIKLWRRGSTAQTVSAGLFEQTDHLQAASLLALWDSEQQPSEPQEPLRGFVTMLLF